jgi:hypothetical protein
MLKIAHRGNTLGPSFKENHPDHIKEALSRGFDSEIDVWLVDKKLWLGHDKPQYQIPENFLNENVNKLWIHCKNLAALEYFVKSEVGYKYFWHENDDHTLTSNGIIWTYPEKPITDRSILVIKGDVLPPSCRDAFGICSDYVESIGL